MNNPEQPTRKQLLGGVLFLLVVVIGLFGGIVYTIIWALKASDAYQTGLESARHNDAIADLIGSPVEAGFWVFGSISLSGALDLADISFPAHGPEGSGNVHVVGNKTDGVWQYSTVTFEPQAEGREVDLLPQSSE